jgi:allophanate hydrolase subunit 2
LSLQVLEAFGHITLQGPPHPGLRKFGVPPGGAFDQESHSIANAILSNPLEALTLELAMASAKLKAIRHTRVSVVGAKGPLSIDGRKVPSQSAFDILPGQVLEIGQPTSGARTYVGFKVREIRGVQPRTAVRTGELLKAGTMLTLDAESGTGAPLQKLPQPPSSLTEGPIRVIAFGSDHNLNELADAKLTVRLDSDRVGIRLYGLRLDPGPEQLSEPSCPGVIQVTNDGGLIIHGPDGPTIGGYRKIGVVCTADMNLVAQLRPGAECRFTEITHEQAVKLAQVHHRL